MARNGIVHVVDDDLAVRKALAFLLAMADLSVRLYESATAFLAQLPDAAPGCVVTDVRMAGIDGLELLRRIKVSNSPMPVVVMTAHGDIPMAVQAMRMGAIDFVEKPFDDAPFLVAVRNALEAASAVSAPTATAANLDLLSRRERQVLDGILCGKANKMIARDLSLSPRTVEVYRANLMAKLDARSLPDLVRKTLAAGGLRVEPE